jgi:predicted flap endonuclease-1-like 5' DNA nuclease
MFESTLYLAILRDIVLFLGIVISWIYWRRRNSEREAHIKDLETSLTGKDTNMNDFENRLQEQETELGSLNTQLSQREETVRGLTAQIKERDNSINVLKMEVADLKKQSQGSTTRAKEAEAGAEDLKKSAQQQKNKIESLNTQLSQREETIRGLTAQLKERDNSINVLKVGVADLEKKNQNSMTRARNAEARIVELEKSMREKEQEDAALMARMQVMQDDFTCIVGIGPKVSAVLRSAGINTFAKLAASDVKGIRGVLEAEDPRLLRLTDPSAWPEQARMAAEGDWEALSALQGSPKRGRRA